MISMVELAKCILCGGLATLTIFLLLLSRNKSATNPVRIRNNKLEQTSRQLSLLNFNDPKTVSLKDNNIQQPWAHPMKDILLPRPMNILAIGGTLHSGAYPWIIGSPNDVDCFDTALLGPYFTSACLESLLPEMKNYDVILLGFYSSEVEGFRFPWLLQRLREKYPDAIVIYVHLLPLKDLLQNPETGLLPDTLGHDSNMDWQWMDPNTDNHKFHTKLTHGTRKAVTEAGAYHFQLDFPQDPKVAITWYLSDWLHLSDTGHIMVANGILGMLSALQDDLFKPKRLGSFAKGDQCFHWFADGEAEISYSDTVMKKSNLQNISSENYSDIWFLEIDADKAGSIQFENRFSTSVSVVLAYISNREIESIFSSVNATIADQPTVKINPNNFYSPKHVVQYAFVGNSLPGSNAVQLKSSDREAGDLRPFRVVALLLNEDTEHSKPLLTDGLEIPNYGRHIVFCSIPPDPRFSYMRVDNDQMEKVVSTAQIRLSSHWTIHAITSGEAAVYKLLSSHSTRYAKVVDYRNAPSSHLLKRFNRLFLPQSPRDVEFEKFCIYRWIIILEYFEYIKMRGVSVDHIFSADTDLFVLDSPFLLNKAIDWGGIESYTIVTGAAIIWSLQGLHSFVTFIMEAYHAPREHMVELVRSYGAYVGPCQPGSSQYVPCYATDPSCPSRFGTCMYQMSDMQWQSAWAAQNPMLRLQNTRYDCGVMNSMDQSADYVFVHDGSEIQLKTGSIGLHKVCFVHFGGGGEVKNMIVPFYSFVFNADKSSSFSKP